MIVAWVALVLALLNTVALVSVVLLVRYVARHPERVTAAVMGAMLGGAAGAAPSPDPSVAPVAGSPPESPHVDFDAYAGKRQGPGMFEPPAP